MRILAALMTLLPLTLAAQMSTTISFDPPVTREDGTELDPATEIAHYDLYCRYQDAEGFSNDAVMEIPGLTETGEHQTTYDSFLPEKGRYDCALTATDTEGRESEHSNTVDVAWLGAPGTPTNVIIVTE